MLAQELELGGLHQNSMGKLGAMTQAYNPSYSGGRDQEDLDSKPAQGYPTQYRAGRMAQVVGHCPASMILRVQTPVLPK
jgi:hypothetical protein